MWKRQFRKERDEPGEKSDYAFCFDWNIFLQGYPEALLAHGIYTKAFQQTDITEADKALRAKSWEYNYRR